MHLSWCVLHTKQPSWFCLIMPNSTNLSWNVAKGVFNSSTSHITRWIKFSPTSLMVGPLCPGRGLLLTFVISSLKVNIFLFVKSCTSSLSTMQVSKQCPTAPLWYHLWHLGCTMAGMAMSRDQEIGESPRNYGSRAGRVDCTICESHRREPCFSDFDYVSDSESNDFGEEYADVDD